MPADTPRFLTLAEALEIHQDQIARYGGIPGIRDLDLLKSALAMPAASFGGQYLHSGLREMAAAYLFHLVSNHPFVDGNKRVGAVAALIFMELNGLAASPPQKELYEAVMAVARGELDKADLAVRMKRWAGRG